MSTETDSLSSYDPPPSYREVDGQSLPDAEPNAFPDDKTRPLATDEEDSVAGGPSSTPAARTLYIKFGNWLWTKAQMLDSDQTTVVYNAEFRARQPWVTLKSPDNALVGTGIFHMTTTRIDTVVYDNNVNLKSLGWFKDGFTFTSKALGGEIITWKSIGKKTFHIKAMDQSGKIVAQVLFGKWSMKNGGTIELLDSRCSQAGLFMDEIIVTGTTIIQSRIVNSSAAVS